MELANALRQIDGLEEENARNAKNAQRQTIDALELPKTEDPEKKRRRNLLRRRESDVLHQQERELRAAVRVLKDQIAEPHDQLQASGRLRCRRRR